MWGKVFERSRGAGVECLGGKQGKGREMKGSSVSSLGS